MVKWSVILPLLPLSLGMNLGRCIAARSEHCVLALVLPGALTAGDLRTLNPLRNQC